MDDEELAESVAKRKQAEAHGYVAPAIIKPVRSGFGDGIITKSVPSGGAGGDEDEDDFFSLKKKVPNGEDMDEEPDLPTGGVGATTPGGGKSKSKPSKSKRKAEGEREFDLFRTSLHPTPQLQRV